MSPARAPRAAGYNRERMATTAEPRHYRVSEDVSHIDPDADIGLPGASLLRAACSRRCTAAAPGRCGSTPGFATAAESNARYRYLLAQGMTGLSVAFDLPTQIGYDSDHPLAAGEVGASAWPSTRSKT